MSDTYGRYIIIAPVIAVNLDLLAFGRRYTWQRRWDDLHDLNGRILGDQFKVFTYVEDIKRKPTKLFFCLLIDSLSEEEASESRLMR